MKPRNATGRYMILFIIATLACAQASWCASKKSEESMGRQYAEEFEKQAVLATDKQVLDHVNKIGQSLAKIANTYEVPAGYGSSDISKFKYQFKVVEDEDVNAISLPGGIIYVNTGLIDLVESDDELAGVLAHEIAHAAHHHVSHLIKKSSAVDRYVALIALAGILGNARARDMNNLMMGAQMLQIGKMSSYTLEAERDADKTAVAYLARSTYNPEGLVTFMRKLEEQHATNPTAALGIFQDHPLPAYRAMAITKAMEELGMKTNVRKLRDVAYAKAEPVAEGSDRYRVMICERVLYQPASITDGQTSKDRADQIAVKVNSALDAGMCSRDIICDSSENCLQAKSARIVSIDPQDTVASGMSSAQLLAQARKTLEFAVWADWVATRCSTETYQDDER